MGKKKQRKGAPDLDDEDFPDPLEAANDAEVASSDAQASGPKKQDKKKKAKKVSLSRCAQLPPHPE